MMAEASIEAKVELAVAEVVMGWSHEQAMRVAESRQGRLAPSLAHVFAEWEETSSLGESSRKSLDVWLLLMDTD